MSKKLYWGLGFLIVLFGTAFVFMMLRTGAENWQLKQELADVKELKKNKTEQPVTNNKPPREARPGFEWVQHDGHWYETLVAQTHVDIQQNDAMYGVTRQGTRYLKNPMWADRKEAHIISEGKPLNINWSNYNIAIGNADWWDPRTWESFRNFFGFDRPKVRANGSWPYRVRIDNWGTPLQQFDNVSLVVRYSKRIGFRPTQEQFSAHQALSSRYEAAQLLGDTATADSLRQQIANLEASAQGELPRPTSYFSAYYGDTHPDWKTLSHDEKHRMNKEQEEVGIKNLYKRLGIEHLYEFYEKP